MLRLGSAKVRLQCSDESVKHCIFDSVMVSCALTDRTQQVEVSAVFLRGRRRRHIPAGEDHPRPSREDGRVAESADFLDESQRGCWQEPGGLCPDLAAGRWASDGWDQRPPQT